jgi:hypothetical protein
MSGIVPGKLGHTITVPFTLSFHDTIPQMSNLRQEGFIVAHSHKGLNPWSLGPLAVGLCRGRR